MSNELNSMKKARATHALFFELEFVAIPGRKVAFDALTSAMATKGVELKSIMYSRSGMSPLARQAVIALLKQAGKKYDAIEKAVAEVENKTKAFCEKEASLNEDLKKLIETTSAKGIPVYAFTALPEAVASALMDKLGLSDMGVELIIPDEVKASFPRADSWLKMLKKCDKEDATLVAVVSSKTSCKGALTAGAACVVVPDEFTEFQDFSGAKLVLSSLGDVKAEEILDLTLRM